MLHTNNVYDHIFVDVVMYMYRETLVLYPHIHMKGNYIMMVMAFDVART